jgi:hypothetical protein
MGTRVTKSSGTTVTIETTLDVSGPMLRAEEAILAAVNEVGAVATAEALKRFDADGEPITIGGMKWYAKQPKEKYYQSPYGEILVERYVYQKAGGGSTFCPLEQGARILRNATPRFAKMVAHKLAQEAALDVQRDLEENHGWRDHALATQRSGLMESAAYVEHPRYYVYDQFKAGDILNRHLHLRNPFSRPYLIGFLIIAPFGAFFYRFFGDHIGHHGMIWVLGFLAYPLYLFLSAQLSKYIDRLF